MLWSLVIELPAWVLGILLGLRPAAWVFFGLPLVLALVGRLNRRECRARAQAALESLGNPLAPAEKAHLFKYATTYFFPAVSVEISRFYSGVCFLCIATVFVEGYRWVADVGFSLWNTVGGVVGWLLAGILQVQYKPLHFAASQVRRDRVARSRYTEMAIDDLVAGERIRVLLAEHPEIVDGDQFWRIFQNLSTVHLTAKEAADRLLAFCDVSGDDSPADGLGHLPVSNTVLLEEVLCLRIFSVHLGILHSNWQIPEQIIVGRAFADVLPDALCKCIPGALSNHRSSEELIALSEQRYVDYAKASKVPHEKGAVWQVARRFVELCNAGSWEDMQALRYAAVIHGSTLDAVSEMSRRWKIN